MKIRLTERQQLLAIIVGILAMLFRAQRRTVLQREDALQALGDPDEHAGVDNRGGQGKEKSGLDRAPDFGHETGDRIKGT